MNNQEIVAKLWNLCNVLRDDGITYHQYVTELTYILFLKMCKETGTEGAIPEQYRWDKLLAKQGVELKKFYKELLEHTGQHNTAAHGDHVCHRRQAEQIGGLYRPQRFYQMCGAGYDQRYHRRSVRDGPG